MDKVVSYSFVSNKLIVRGGKFWKRKSCILRNREPVIPKRLYAWQSKELKPVELTKIVLASTRGDTARLAAEKLRRHRQSHWLCSPSIWPPGRAAFPIGIGQSTGKNKDTLSISPPSFSNKNLYGTTNPRVMAALLRTFFPGNEGLC